MSILLVNLMTAYVWSITGGLFLSNFWFISKFLHNTDRVNFISIMAKCFARQPLDPVQKGT